MAILGALLEHGFYGGLHASCIRFFYQQRSRYSIGMMKIKAFYFLNELIRIFFDNANAVFTIAFYNFVSRGHAHLMFGKKGKSGIRSFMLFPTLQYFF